ncbi:DUF4386 domain-containing protein [Demequina sp. SYSU T00192]|uniref:DUF4386 domain-containing protein n=1 Tax=Demequina litoralis TaxID=3051660 RepID=A0ABT8G9R1_9MICO|nr:DUF4386 domain-containing protein [Demequina sp. SYSU T00192]MDN4475865.1 DUF4386 domain-containing protein [Demequina sp. SYSU T00192]
MSAEHEPHGRRSAIARTAGALYLSFILASFLADQIGRIGLSNEDALVDLIATAEMRFRVGLVFALVSQLLFLLAAWALQVLLRPFGRSLAQLFLVLNAVGVAVYTASLVVLTVGLGSEAGVGATLVAIDLHGNGVVAAQLFFSTWLVPLGVLLLRSRLVPRALGYLVLLDAVAVAFWFLQALLVPDQPELSYPAFAVSLLAEAGLALCLLVRGAPEPAPRT